MFATLLPLPVDTAQVDGGLTVTFSLDFKALMTDLDIQPVPLVSAVLCLRPLFTPDDDVSAFIMFPVLPLTEAILSNRTGGDNDVDVGVASRWVITVAAPMDGGDCAQVIGKKILLNEFVDDPNLLTGRQLIGQGCNKLSGRSSIPARFCPLNLIAEMLELPELFWRMVGQKNLLPYNVLPMMVARLTIVAVA